MKNHASCFALFLTLFISTAVQAQVGIKAGINYASLSQSATEETYEDYQQKAVLGFQAGLVAELPLTSFFAIQPEFLFIQKGGKSQYIFNDNNKSVNRVIYNYIEIPVLAKIKMGNTQGDGAGFYLIGGPFAGLALNGKGENELTILGVTTTNDYDIDYSDEANKEKRLDWGVSLGAGITLGQFFMDARYNLGINNLNDDDADNNNDNAPYLRTRGIGLTVGVILK